MQPLWEVVRRLSKNLELKLPCDPTIPPLGIYPEKTLTEKNTRTLMFTEALLIIAKTWKQPRCLWMDKEAVVHVHNGILLSHKKGCIWVSANEVNKSTAYYTEWNKSEEKNKYPILRHIWNLERWYWWTYLPGSNGDANTDRLMDKGGGSRRGWDEYKMNEMNMRVRWI